MPDKTDKTALVTPPPDKNLISMNWNMEYQFYKIVIPSSEYLEACAVFLYRYLSTRISSPAFRRLWRGKAVRLVLPKNRLAKIWQVISM
jgi:hypothetical protein